VILKRPIRKRHCRASPNLLRLLMPLVAGSINPLFGSQAGHGLPNSWSPPEIYARATNQFTAALLFKPAEGLEDDLSFRLAPWIFQEVVEPGLATHSLRDEFGNFAQTNGVWTVDRERPTVYTVLDGLELRGKLHSRFAYVWCYSAQQGRSDTLQIQGIRITLNHTGDPAIWEVLAEDSNRALIFVSQSLESAAQAQFGPPLSGRRFSIEGSQSQAPRVIVARVLEDGPIPMGPLVYLRAGLSVGTLTCRCMPAQAKRLVCTKVYERLPLTSAMDAVIRSLNFQGRGQASFWPADDAQGSRLASWMRLPDNF
jgi:hypothetical protein